LAVEVATKLILWLIFSLHRKSLFYSWCERFEDSEALASSEDGSRVSLRNVDFHQMDATY